MLNNSKIIISILFISVFLLGNGISAQEITDSSTNSAQSVEIDNQTIEPEQESFFVDPHIKKELKLSIQNVYGQEHVEEIYQNIIKHALSAKENRPSQLKQQDIKRNSDWFKDEIIYMFYVNQFGVVQNNKDNTFNNTEEMLDYLKDLGVTTLYLLPFVDSPMEDSGFDVKSAGCEK